MTSRSWHDLLNDHLDGNPLPPEIDDVQRAELDMLLRGLNALVPPEPPVGLAQRITRAVIADRHQQKRLAVQRWMPYAALIAASLLVVIGFGLMRPAPRPETIARSPKLRDSVTNASRAVVSLTKRTASATAEETARLLPSMDKLPTEPIAPPQPTLEPIREAGEGVSSRIAPVTDSARRAVNLFFRDMPLSRKPG